MEEEEGGKFGLCFCWSWGQNQWIYRGGWRGGLKEEEGGGERVILLEGSGGRGGRGGGRDDAYLFSLYYGLFISVVKDLQVHS